MPPKQHQSAAPVPSVKRDISFGDPTLVVLTVEEAARRLGIGRTTMYDLLSSGKIPSVKIGRLRRVPVEALDAFIAGRLREADLTFAA
ncbi:helix-turn-helix domain-containing protein [Allostreptomyces psammosilenae]|uniref:Excisionase family DNA binding protein n=1 Tax=Allostreptomyces psammosilenae TaxID=1892865 RepID=A0A852ZT94_9ACTN|nr:helix-turn-helix domain-containing protein [Allostreptomyces psammosilenae]NYI05559.1 excisionase family DNA binding protein [Allostreptomyces psammosilenae]